MSRPANLLGVAQSLIDSARTTQAGDGNLRNAMGRLGELRQTNAYLESYNSLQRDYQQAQLQLWKEEQRELRKAQREAQAQQQATLDAAQGELALARNSTFQNFEGEQRSTLQNTPEGIGLAAKAAESRVTQLQQQQALSADPKERAGLQNQIDAAALAFGQLQQEASVALGVDYSSPEAQARLSTITQERSFLGNLGRNFTAGAVELGAGALASGATLVGGAEQGIRNLIPGETSPEAQAGINRGFQNIDAFVQGAQNLANRIDPETASDLLRATERAQLEEDASLGERALNLVGTTDVEEVSGLLARSAPAIAGGALSAARAGAGLLGGSAIAGAAGSTQASLEVLNEAASDPNATAGSRALGVGANLLSGAAIGAGTAGLGRVTGGVLAPAQQAILGRAAGIGTGATNRSIAGGSITQGRILGDTGGLARRSAVGAGRLGAYTLGRGAGGFTGEAIDEGLQTLAQDASGDIAANRAINVDTGEAFDSAILGGVVGSATGTGTGIYDRGQRAVLARETTPARKTYPTRDAILNNTGALEAEGSGVTSDANLTVDRLPTVDPVDAMLSDAVNRGIATGGAEFVSRPVQQSQEPLANSQGILGNSGAPEPQGFGVTADPTLTTGGVGILDNTGVPEAPAIGVTADPTLTTTREDFAAEVRGRAAQLQPLDFQGQPVEPTFVNNTIEQDAQQAQILANAQARTLDIQPPEARRLSDDEFNALRLTDDQLAVETTQAQQQAREQTQRIAQTDAAARENRFATPESRQLSEEQFNQLREAERLAVERARERTAREQQQQERTEVRRAREETELPTNQTLSEWSEFNGRGISYPESLDGTNGNRYRIVKEGDAYLPQELDPDTNAYQTLIDPEGDGDLRMLSAEDAQAELQVRNLTKSPLTEADVDRTLQAMRGEDINTNDDAAQATIANPPTTIAAGDVVVDSGGRVSTVVEGDAEPRVLATNASQQTVEALREATFEDDILTTPVRTDAFIKRRYAPEIPETLPGTLALRLRENSGQPFKIKPNKKSNREYKEAIKSGVLVRVDESGVPLPTQTGNDGMLYTRSDNPRSAVFNLEGSFQFHPSVVAAQGQLGRDRGNRPIVTQREVDQAVAKINARKDENGKNLRRPYDPARVFSGYAEARAELAEDAHRTIIHIPVSQFNQLAGVETDADAPAGERTTLPQLEVEILEDGDAVVRRASGVSATSAGLSGDTLIPVMVDSNAAFDGTRDNWPTELVGLDRTTTVMPFSNTGGQIFDESSATVSPSPDNQEAYDLLSSKGVSGEPISARSTPELFAQAQRLVEQGLARVDQEIMPGRSGANRDNLRSRFTLLDAKAPDAPQSRTISEPDTHYGTGQESPVEAATTVSRVVSGLFGVELQGDAATDALVLSRKLTADNWGNLGNQPDRLEAVVSDVLQGMSRLGTRINNTRNREGHAQTIRRFAGNGGYQTHNDIQQAIDDISQTYGIEAPTVVTDDVTNAMRDSDSASDLIAASFMQQTNRQVEGSYDPRRHTIYLSPDRLAGFEAQSAAERNLSAYTLFHETGHAVSDWAVRDGLQDGSIGDVITEYFEAVGQRDLSNVSNADESYTFDEWLADESGKILASEIETGEAQTNAPFMRKLVDGLRAVWDRITGMPQLQDSPPALTEALRRLRETAATRRQNQPVPPAVVANSAVQTPLYRGEVVPAGTARGDESGRVRNNSLGFMFSSDPVIADSFSTYRSGQSSASPRTGTYYGNVQKPLEIEGGGQPEFTPANRTVQSDATQAVLDKATGGLLQFNQALIDEAKRLGYDSIIVRDIQMGSNAAGSDGAVQSYVEGLQQQFQTREQLDSYFNSLDPNGESINRGLIEYMWANGVDEKTMAQLAPTDMTVVFDRGGVYDKEGTPITERDALLGGQPSQRKKPLRLQKSAGPAGRQVTEPNYESNRSKPERRKRYVGHARAVKQSANRLSGIRAERFSGVRDLPTELVTELEAASGRTLSDNTASFSYDGQVWINTEAVESESDVQATLLQQVLLDPKMRAKSGPKTFDRIVEKAIADGGGVAYANSFYQDDSILKDAENANRLPIMLLDAAVATENEVLIGGLRRAARSGRAYLNKSFPALKQVTDMLPDAGVVELLSGASVLSEHVVKNRRIIPEGNATETIVHNYDGFRIASSKPGIQGFVSRTGLKELNDVGRIADRLKEIPRTAKNDAAAFVSTMGAERSVFDKKLQEAGFKPSQLKNLGSIDKLNQWLKVALKNPVRNEASGLNRAIQRIAHDMRSLYALSERWREKINDAIATNEKARNALSSLGDDVAAEPELGDVAQAFFNAVMPEPLLAASKKVKNDYLSENYQDILNIFSHQDRATNQANVEYKDEFHVYDVDIDQSITAIMRHERSLGRRGNEADAKQILNDTMRLFHTPEYIANQILNDKTQRNRALEAMPKKMREEYDASGELKQQEILSSLFDMQAPDFGKTNDWGTYTSPDGTEYTIEDWDMDWVDSIREMRPMGFNIEEAWQGTNELYNSEDGWTPETHAVMRKAMRQINKKTRAIQDYAQRANLADFSNTLAFNEFTFPVSDGMNQTDTYSFNPSASADNLSETITEGRGLDPIDALQMWGQGMVTQAKMQPMAHAVLGNVLAAKNNETYNRLTDNAFEKVKVDRITVGSDEHKDLLKSMKSASAQGYTGVNQMLVNLPGLTDPSGQPQTILLGFSPDANGDSLISHLVSKKGESNLQLQEKISNSRNPLVRGLTSYANFKARQLTSWDPQHILRSAVRDNAQMISSAIGNNGIAGGKAALDSFTDVHSMENMQLINKYIRLDEAIGRSKNTAKADRDALVAKHPMLKELQKLRELGAIPEYNKQFARVSGDNYLTELARNLEPDGTLSQESERMVDGLESVARTVDMLTRLAAYRSQKTIGNSDQQAAQFALDIAPFHRSGDHPLMPLFQNAFIFWRSSTTGGVHILDQLLTAEYNTEVAAASLAIGTALVTVLAMASPEDDDGRNKFLANGVTDQNLNIFTPWSERPITVPLPYHGTGSFIRAGMELAVGAMGEQSARKTAGGVVRGFTESISPLNTAVPFFDEGGNFQPGTKLLHLLTPEVFRNYMETKTNLNSFGQPIVFGDQTLDYRDAFDVSQRNVGDWIDNLSRGMAALGINHNARLFRHMVQSHIPLVDQAMDSSFAAARFFTGSAYDSDVEDLLIPLGAFIGSDYDRSMSRYYETRSAYQPSINKLTFMRNYRTDQEIVESGEFDAREIAFLDEFKRTSGRAQREFGQAKQERQNPYANSINRQQSSNLTYQTTRDGLLESVRALSAKYPEFL